MTTLFPKKVHKNGHAPILLLVVALVLIGASVGLYSVRGQLLKRVPTSPTSRAACTMEAKQCPDGSYVSRQGPKCEFASCSSPTNQSANWKIYEPEGSLISFQYPSNWYESKPSGEGNPEGSASIIKFSNYPFTNNGLYMSFESSYSKENDYVTISLETSWFANRTSEKFINDVKAQQGQSHRNVTNQNSLEFTEYQQTNPPSISASIANGEFGYTVTLTAPSEPVLEKNRSVFNQVVSTFKFTDQSTPSVEGKRCGYLGPPGEDTSCPSGYTCKMADPSNDAGGVCVKL